MHCSNYRRYNVTPRCRCTQFDREWLSVVSSPAWMICVCAENEWIQISNSFPMSISGSILCLHVWNCLAWWVFCRWCKSECRVWTTVSAPSRALYSIRDTRIRRPAYPHTPAAKIWKWPIGILDWCTANKCAKTSPAFLRASIPRPPKICRRHKTRRHRPLPQIPQTIWPNRVRRHLKNSPSRLHPDHTSENQQREREREKRGK